MERLRGHLGAVLLPRTRRRRSHVQPGNCARSAQKGNASLERSHRRVDWGDAHRHRTLDCMEAGRGDFDAGRTTLETHLRRTAWKERATLDSNRPTVLS